MGNTVNKFIFFLIICVNLCACITQKTDYTSFLHPEYILVEGDQISGWLKEDIIIETPYGKMKAAAIGGKSGYLFDLICYGNGNPKIIWLRDDTDIIYDSMHITLPAFRGGARGVFFHKNFKIERCRNKNEVEYMGIFIPANSSLHFDENGKLCRLTVEQDWMVDGVMYYIGQNFNIIDKKIVPDYKNIRSKGDIILYEEDD